MIDRLLSRSDKRLQFLRGFLREPKQVGWVTPSSRFLERRLVSLAAISQADSVVELGPGTGGTTRAILHHLPASARLLAIEIDPHFVELLQKNNDSRLAVHHGSAEDLLEILQLHGMKSPQAIISGIPFSTMSPEMGRRVMGQIEAALSPGGFFVAYQIRDHVAQLGRPVFGSAESWRELRNLPPARIFRFQKATHDG